MCVGGGIHHFYEVSRLSLYGHTGILGSGRSPLLRPMAWGGGGGKGQRGKLRYRHLPLGPLRWCFALRRRPR